MKILYISGNIKKTGGIQRYNAHLIEALRKNGQKISAIQLINISILGKIFFAAEAAIKCLLFKPNVIICSHINFAPLVSFLNKIFKVPYLLLTYGIEVWRAPTDDEKKFVSESILTTAISNFTKDKVIKNFSVNPEKIFLLPNPINGEEFYIKEKNADLVKNLGIKDKKVIFTLARLSSQEKYKGYDKIIESLPEVLKKVPNAFYILAGAGDDKKRILDLINRKNLGSSVYLAGYLDKSELVDYYNLCDVFAMPSKGEGFGFVFLEALACGKPVIAGNKDGSVDAVLGGKLGILVDPDNIEEITNAIVNTLAKKVDLNLTTPDALRSGVIEAYGTDAFNKKVLSLINKFHI